MEPLFDPSHRVTRGLTLAVNMRDLMPLLLLMKLIYTFSYGPWDGGKWWQSAIQSARANILGIKADAAGLWNGSVGQVRAAADRIEPVSGDDVDVRLERAWIACCWQCGSADTWCDWVCCGWDHESSVHVHRTRAKQPSGFERRDDCRNERDCPRQQRW